VKLHEVEALQPRVLQALVDVLFDVFGREGFVEREVAAAGPLHVLRGDFGGRVDSPVGVAADEFAEQSLAAPLTVDPSGVEEVAAEFDGALERAQRLLVVRTRPAPHAPHAVADLADLPARAPETTIPQLPSSPRKPAPV
jgi:hypothetical protein